MQITQTHINTDFLPLKGTDHIQDVIGRMETEGSFHLPVVDNATHKLIGQVFYTQLKDKVSAEIELIADIELEGAVKIYQGQHVFEAARLMLQYEMSMLPVINDESTLLGVLERKRVMETIVKMLNLSDTGAVITIELEHVDFSLTEIVHLIETEGGKILGMAVETPQKEKPHFEVSIKLNEENVNRVVSSLKRHDYSVRTESGSEVFAKDLKNRADELLKYIDM